MSQASDIISQRRSYTPLFSQWTPGVVRGYTLGGKGKGDMDFYPFEIVKDLPLPANAELMLPAALPTNSTARKRIPMCSGLLDYFPAALAEVAKVSFVANEQHNPGEPMRWAREKSRDQSDCIMRHLVERGATDTDGLRHSAKLAWRALALLQEELEAAGAQPGRASRWPEKASG